MPFKSLKQAFSDPYGEPVVDEKAGPAPPPYSATRTRPDQPFIRDFIQPGLEKSTPVPLLELRVQPDIVDCPACSARAWTRIEYTPGRLAKQKAFKRSLTPWGMFLTNRKLNQKDLQAIQHFCTNCACILVQYDAPDDDIDEVHKRLKVDGEKLYRVPYVPRDPYYQRPRPYLIGMGFGNPATINDDDAANTNVWCLAEHERLLSYSPAHSRGWAYEHGHSRWGGDVLWHGPWLSPQERNSCNHSGGFCHQTGRHEHHDPGYGTWAYGHSHSHSHGHHYSHDTWSGGHSYDHGHSSGGSWGGDFGGGSSGGGDSGGGSSSSGGDSGGGSSGF